MLGLIPLIIIIISLVAIILIVVLKLPKISIIDISTIPEEKSNEMKNKILRDRLQRKTNEQFNLIVGILRPIWKVSQKSFRILYQRVVDLERKYRRKYRPLLNKEDLAQNIDELLKKANDFKINENYASAEKQYIEIISLDSKNYEAYRGLADLYITKKEYESAQEVLTYLIKLNLAQQKKMENASGHQYQEAVHILQKDLSESYFDRGITYQALGNIELSYDDYNESVKFEPNNPRYLDALLDITIILGKKVKAIDLFNVLKKVNPDNKKLDEFSERIKDMTI